jgi:16S rRNA (guanine966-N2)-methyltransferase
MNKPRIIQGIYKNRTLSVPEEARPVTDRVKKIIFDNLNNIIDFENIAILDLFAGSGNLGIEAFSRGGLHSTFVDNSTEAIKIIENNLYNLEIDQGNTTLVKNDSIEFINSAADKYDLIFIDPPFEQANRLKGIDFKHLIKESGVLVIKYPENIKYDTPQGFNLYKRQKIGINCIDILISI